MRMVIVLFIILNTSTILVAQEQKEILDSRPLNSIYLNLLGDASIYSINYERLFKVNPTFFISGKSGAGVNVEFRFCIFGPCKPLENYLTIPHHITGNIGKGRRFFEFGIGGTIIGGNTTQPYLLYPIIGYRIMPLKRYKINFRVFAQIPFSGLDTDDILFSPIGLSVGKSF